MKQGLNLQRLFNFCKFRFRIIRKSLKTKFQKQQKNSKRQTEKKNKSNKLAMNTTSGNSKSRRHLHSMLDICPIYSPRTSYKRIKQNDEKMIADMTLNFDKLTIKLLKEQFLTKSNEMNLQEFIITAKRHLKFWRVDAPNRDVSIVRYLTYLFNEIDINGNGDMEWEEFTNYVIEKATVLKNLKSKAEEVKHYVKSDLSIKVKVDSGIQKLEYIPQLDKVAYFQEGSNKISFFTLATGQPSAKSLILDAKNLVVNISSVKKEKNGRVSIRKKDLVLPTNVRILDMLYIPDKKYKILVISTSDGIVRGWKNQQGSFVRATQPDNQEELFEHTFSSEIYCLAWDNINEILYCGQKNGSICIWNLKTDLEKSLEEKDINGSIESRNPKNEFPQEKINCMITSMITMPKLQFLASGRMDGKLILWDTINNKKKWIYKEHTRGILTLAFNQTMILLFSAGFDHKICIWNPYIQAVIHKIEGHLSPILSLKVVENSHQLISMDQQGIVKITDTKRFHIIYSFSVDTTNEMGEQGGSKKASGSAVNSLIAINNPLKLIFGGRTLSIYEYDKNYSPQSADQHTVICCRYVKSLLSFFTPAGNKIKVWSALNGDVQKIYMDVTQNEISTFDFDFLQKRMIIGDTKGNITMHNTVNGAKMKSLAKHNGEVTHLLSTQNDCNVDIFISCGVDNEIKVAKQTEESFEIIRTIFIRKDICITCLKYIEEIKSIVVGTNVGSVVFYDIETGKNSGNVTTNSYEEITAICKTEQSIILATTSSGAIIVIGLPPLPTRFQKIITIQHFDEQKEKTPIGIRASCYSKEQKCIFVVDDKMYLTCYSFENVLDKMRVLDYNKEKTESQRRQVVYKVFDTQHDIILKKWTVKAHSELIKSIEYIEEENLIITSSFDKKVKIWNSLTGQYIDSLQQNYTKKQPQPIAYLDTKKNIFYSNDKKKAFPNMDVDLKKTQFDPFYLNKILSSEPSFGNQASNKDWSLKVNFQSQALIEIMTFQELTIKLREIEKSIVNENCSDQIGLKLKQIQKGLATKRQMLKEISTQGNLNSLSPFASTTQCFDSSASDINTTNRNNSRMSGQGLKKISSNYFKHSMIKCIQNFIDKNQNNELINVLKQQEEGTKRKKRTDFIPILKMINTNENSHEADKKHRLYIDELSRKETQNIINSRKDKKILLDREGAEKARKLCRLLIDTDRKDQRPKILMKSIEIRGRDNRLNPLSHRQRSGKSSQRFMSSFS